MQTNILGYLVYLIYKINIFLNIWHTKSVVLCRFKINLSFENRLCRRDTY